MHGGSLCERSACISVYGSDLYRFFVFEDLAFLSRSVEGHLYLTVSSLHGESPRTARLTSDELRN